VVALTAILLILGGIFACAPLFKRVSKGLERLMVALGLVIGIAIFAVAIDAALNLNFLGTNLLPGSNAFPYSEYTLIVMAVLGLLLFSRPLRNVRWASLVALGVGILAAAALHSFLGVSSNIVLGVVFLIVLLIVYTLLRFVEDILEFIGTVLAFAPIAVIIGLVSIYFGIMTYGV
jgi:hypothetical protein